MSIWWVFALGGLLWSAVLLAVLTAYAKALLWCTRFTGARKVGLTYLCYFLCVCVLVGPLLTILMSVQWRKALFISESTYIAFVALYFLAAVPGILFVRRRYLRRLQQHGFFTGE